MTYLIAVAFILVGVLIGLALALWLALHITRTPEYARGLLKGARESYLATTGDPRCPACGSLPSDPNTRQDLS